METTAKTALLPGLSSFRLLRYYGQLHPESKDPFGTIESILNSLSLRDSFILKNPGMLTILARSEAYSGFPDSGRMVSQFLNTVGFIEHVIDK